MSRSMIPFSLACALLLGSALAIAQQAPGGTGADDPKAPDAQKSEDGPAKATDSQGTSKDTVPPATGRNLAEQAGTTEPSSKVKGTSEDENVFVNGVLAVAGARSDVDTAPAKFSARNAADDRAPIADYRMRHLTDDQRREIVGLLGKPDEAKAGAGTAYARIGAEIPAELALNALTPVPDAAAARFPELRGTAFVRAGNKVLIIDRDNSLVVGVLDS
jgi:hypothetical protein